VAAGVNDSAKKMIVLCGITKTYGTDRPVHALRGIDLEIAAGEYLAIMGPSGSGKSTLMNIVGCLDRPTAGEYYLDGEDVSVLSDGSLARIRNASVGFVFQTFNLLPRQSAQRNVELPLVYRGLPLAERARRASAVLARVGLREWSHHRPNQLSGGQQQRVAIARALVGPPRFLLADEPTGNLDSRSGQSIMVLIEELNREGMTVLLVTHDERIARHARRIIQLFDGRLVRDERNHDVLDASVEFERISAQAQALAEGAHQA
jgi:putative ABC transport system ATP-binding protein